MGVGNRTAAVGREILNPVPRTGYNRIMPSRVVFIARAALLLVALVAASGADAQSRRKHDRAPAKEVERPAPAVPVDKRDSVVAAAAGAFTGRPFWVALAQCGGIYFKLNLLYTDIAVHARAVKLDPKLNTEYTKKLNDAIRTATVYFAGAEHLLMSERGVERIDAVLTYDEQSRAAGDRIKTIDAALNAAKACPALYQACQDANSKACGEPLPPLT
jgi:hypothetical protein